MIQTFRLCIYISILVLLSACSEGKTPLLSSPTSIPATQTDTVTATVTVTHSPSPTIETPTPEKTLSPTPTLTPTSELLSCPQGDPDSEAVSPIQIIYTTENNVWLWAETSGEKTQINLPEGAVAPVISEDGRFIAFTQEGQSYDQPDKAVPSIPLWLYDREKEQAYQIGTYLTTSIRKLYTESPRIYLQMQWLPGGHWLLVQVYPFPWGEGSLQPTGDLFLVNADQGTNKLVLKGGLFERLSIRPDGGQIAALDTAAFDENGMDNWDAIQDGKLYLIDVSSGKIKHSLPVRLPADPWAMIAPAYSPDGKRLVLDVENGFAVIDVQAGSMQEIPMKNTCVPDSCYWTDYLPVYWLADSRSFYTLTTINDYWDERSETTLSQVYLEPAPMVATIALIHAHTWSFSFSPDKRYVSFWNQPDVDKLENGTAEADWNWVTLHVMDMHNWQPKRYMAQYLLRNLGWSPNNRYFVYSYSHAGGPNPVMDRVSLGDICQPPQPLPAPHPGILNHIRWLDDSRFLAWTLPMSLQDNLSETGLYLYRLDQGSDPLLIDYLVEDYSTGYGTMSQVVVLKSR
jgi:hypothetical protein